MGGIVVASFGYRGGLLEYGYDLDGPVARSNIHYGLNKKTDLVRGGSGM